MKKIPVRYGLELILPINILLIGFMILACIDEKWHVITTLFPVTAAINVLIFKISYFIEQDKLLVRNSIFGITTIYIAEITKIEKTSNLLSAPAPSVFGRIEIFYKKESIIISPKNYEDFVAEMLKINPNIELK